jgi:DNA mismatch repair protein MutS2
MNVLPTKTQVDLDWSRLLQALAVRCVTPMGQEAAMRLELLDDAAQVALRCAEVGEARMLREEGHPLPLDGFTDITPQLDRAARQAVLGIEELLSVQKTLAATRRLTAHLSEHRERAPKLARHLLPRGTTEAQSLRDLEELLDSCIEEDGSLSDHASPELALARGKVRSLKERLSGLVQELVDSYADVLQDRYFTLRDDRYVLPVRTDAHRRVHGIVHGHSGSGQTIYVEPREITSLGNELVLAQTDVAREEQRVLADLSEELRIRSEVVARALSGAVEVDLRAGAARLARDLDGSEPKLSHDGRLALSRIRHPLLVLDRSEVVPNDIELRGGGVLVVSGPNGGGKTVALKTVGISLLMLRAGLPLPADPESVMPVARTVWTDMGDDQSLEQSLSTFAAHMKNIAHILGSAGPGDVVLLDELAGGTDPTEGAALAAEIARALADRGAAVMCSTHYGSLKVVALSEEGFEGASLGFDKENLSPTFRLATGAPGVSGALAAAQRYGLPGELVEAARDRMGEDSRRLGELMEELEAERERLRSQAEAAVEDRSALDRERRALAVEREELRKKERAELDRQARELMGALRSAREEVRRIEERLRRRRRVSEKDVKSASKALGKVAADLGPGGALSAALVEGPPPGRPAGDDDLQTGAKVYVTTVGGEGEVLEPPRKGKVKVAVGRVTMTVQPEALRVLEKKASAPTKRHFTGGDRVKIDAAGDAEVPAMTPDNTLDVRGERVDDAIREADKFIDRALQRGWQNVFFIHGHGTGALRDGLRRHFDEIPYVERWKGGERRQGGDGVTVIWLAD